MTVLTNARIVLPDRVILGSLSVRGTLIEAVAEGRSHLPGAIDCAGDYLIPGVIDVHTDNLERQVQPRHTARWPSRSALVAHDAQCAGAGVTTVLDALCVGDLGFDRGRLQTYRDGVGDLDALAGTGLLKSEHFLHLRCELPAPDLMDLVEPAIDNARLRMVSLMDHSPGVGQYADLDRYRTLRRTEGLADDVIECRVAELQAQRETWRTPNRRALLARLAGHDVHLASHDDRTEEEIEENFRDGIRISEFPVHMDAARAARARGMEIIAGAPNIVRGGSHSGNVAVAELVRAGVIDALASDYVPASLVEAAFLAGSVTGITLPEAVALVTDRPARMCGLPDRGRLAPGLRADLVRVHLHAAAPEEELPVVRQVWRAGERVA
jgi:alpha-D-ribose 1-methylphosphonate 5-triphosphate diphosphatase